MALKKLYAEISKVEDQDDGTIKVWGYASTAEKDSDGETVTADAMKAALPDYMKWGAVREMHQPKAAGTAIEAEVQEDGRTWFGAHVIDSEAVRKVQKGVYKGFSVGGKVTSRDELNKSVIKGISLVEISLVDRPANPSAMITLCKVAGDDQDEGDDSGGAPGAAQEAIDALADLLNKGIISPDRLLELAKGEHADDGKGKGKGAPDHEGGETKPDEMTKAGARFSKSTKGALAKIHEAAREVASHLDSLGYMDDAEGGDAGKGAAGDDLKKVEAAHEELLKACGAAGLAEGMLAADFVAKLASERDTLAKRVKDLEAMPAPGKALLKAVGKGEDVGDANLPKLEPITKADGSTDDVASLIKFIHQTGGARAG